MQQRMALLQRLSFDRVLQTVPSGLFLVDTDQRIVFWNREAERLTGYAADEVLGRHCSFLKGFPCGEAAECGLLNPEVPKPLHNILCSFEGKDGRRFKLLKNMDWLRNEAGEIIGGVESFIDVSQQDEVARSLRQKGQDLEQAVIAHSEQLREERSQLRTLLDAMSDLAYIIDGDYRITFMNRALVKLFGSRLGEFCYTIMHGRDLPCEDCPLPVVLKGVAYRHEQHLSTTGRTYEVIHNPMRASDGSVRKLAIFRDITERKQAEEELRETNRALDAFTCTVSHDLRTPLTPIIGFAEFLREEYRDRLDDQALDLLGDIESQGKRMLALLEDLLVLSRVGWVEPPAEAVDTSAVVRQIVEELRQSLQEKDLRVEIAPLPRLALPESFVSEIFSNLIGNAIRYAAPLGRPIEVGGEVLESGLRLFVRDHGPGIPEKERSQVFNLFYRGAKAKQEVAGTGIGLATVHKIVSLYDGKIWIDETPGGGASFWIDFPSP